MRISKVPEPALIRSILVAVTGVVAYLIGREIDAAWVETLLTLYGLATPVIAGAIIRPAVTPVTGSAGEARGVVVES
ncbi:hypothetical protein [Nocardia asteroides]|uniref:hypothetical protein n=1 Tax=Nocardia asteroides TaxID=1824 RepID=UPI001E2868FA|nr:hypothetical protein [Nocardia asteroides]UGT52389.1 hypothetical protein LTT85_16725 [Nocardia asteroides]